MHIQMTIQKWGNSLALRLTGPIRYIPHFKENMLVNVEINESGIRVYPIQLKQKKLMFKEKDLLKGLTEKTGHADELAILMFNELGE